MYVLSPLGKGELVAVKGLLRLAFCFCVDGTKRRGRSLDCSSYSLILGRPKVIPTILLSRDCPSPLTFLSFVEALDLHEIQLPVRQYLPGVEQHGARL